MYDFDKHPRPEEKQMLTSSHSNDWADRPPPLVNMLKIPFWVGAAVVGCVGIATMAAKVAVDNIPGRS
jgi:hypothetical protein